MLFYLQIAPVTFLLQLALAILPLTPPITFQLQLPFIFLPEQTANGEAAEIFLALRLLPPAALPPVKKEQERWTGM